MSNDNWIEDPLSKQNKEIKEAALKNVSKASLLHKIETVLDELRDITKERDTLYEENKRLTEENSNLSLVRKRNSP